MANAVPRITLPLHPGYNVSMDEAPLSPLIDYSELKRNIAEAIRATIRELAQEHSMTYDEYLDWCFGDEDEQA